MKITILVNHDLPALLALNYLLPKLGEHRVSVFYTQKEPSKNLPKALHQLMRFEHNVYSNLESAGNKNNLLTLKQLRPHACTDIVQLNSVNTTDFEKLTQSQPELIVSVRHMTILKEAVIKLPQRGVMNLHSGLLPNYQGVMSTFRAMQNNEPILGSTLHFIEDKGIDCGAIIARAHNAASYGKSYLWNVLNLYGEGCQLILDAVDSMTSDRTPKGIPQNGPSHYYSYPTEQDLIEFDRQGFKLYETNDLIDFQGIRL